MRYEADVVNFGKDMLTVVAQPGGRAMSQRSLNFTQRYHNRYWWYRLRESQYVPPIFQNLSDDEWELLNEWFYDTEMKFGSPGEIGVPAMSFMSGIIGGNGISRIVQCGHYVGFSTLMFGFLMRSIGKQRSIFSIDYDADVTRYTSEWVNRSGLDQYVKLLTNDSADLSNVQKATDWLEGAPQIVLIDSSHQYSHTLRELDLWYEALAPGGMLLLHDVSIFAQKFDSTSQGGVLKAVEEWKERTGITPFLLNRFVDGSQSPDSLVYRDGCGMGIIQKH